MYCTKMSSICMLAFVSSFILCLSNASELSPPKITKLWHGGMSDNYGKQPVNEYAIDSRQPAVFKCDASGIPEPLFYWTKNGSALTAGGRISFENEGRDLKITTPTASDNGRYQCNATSNRGTALSQEISAILAFVDSFTDLAPLTINVRPNDKVVMECNPPKSFPKPTITWAMKKNFNVEKYDPVDYSNRVSQTQDGNLILGDAIVEDTGFYVCQVSNAILPTIQDSPTISLQVSGTPSGPRRPTWESIPDSLTVGIVGSDVSFKCIAGGFETPYIEWSGLENEKIYLASYGQEIIIPNVTLSDAGNYQCVAIQGDFEITKGFKFVVEAAPTWVNPPLDVKIAPCETATITCEATGIPTPNITWLMNGAVPPQDTCRTISGNTVTVTDAITDDNAVYQCVAENIHGKIMEDALLSVNVDKPAAEGESVTLKCDHIGRPYPDVSWEGKSGPITDNDKYTINADGSLTINSVVKEDEWAYTCKVVNSGGEDSKELRTHDPVHCENNCIGLIVGIGFVGFVVGISLVLLVQHARIKFRPTYMEYSPNNENENQTYQDLQRKEEAHENIKPNSK